MSVFPNFIERIQIQSEITFESHDHIKGYDTCQNEASPPRPVSACISLIIFACNFPARPRGMPSLGQLAYVRAMLHALRAPLRRLGLAPIILVRCSPHLIPPSTS